MAFDLGLAERLGDMLAPRLGISEKKMFGGLAYLARDYMFIGISGNALMARVDQHCALSWSSANESQKWPAPSPAAGRAASRGCLPHSRRPHRSWPGCGGRQ